MGIPSAVYSGRVDNRWSRKWVTKYYYILTNSDWDIDTGTLLLNIINYKVHSSCVRWSRLEGGVTIHKGAWHRVLCSLTNDLWLSDNRLARYYTVSVDLPIISLKICISFGQWYPMHRYARSSKGWLAQAPSQSKTATILGFSQYGKQEQEYIHYYYPTY